MIELINFTLKDLINPVFYISHGGIWIVMFIIFAETGLMVGFFLPGDSLLLLSGVYSSKLMESVIHNGLENDFIEVMMLFVLISFAGVLGNELGYWIGFKTGPLLFKRKDSWLFKKKYLYQAKEFYDKHGDIAIVLARFLPMLRTFSPIVAGIVKMDKKSFLRYNILGSAAWVFSILMAGHYLERLFLDNFGFDLKEHVFAIIILLLLTTTGPVVYKMFSRKE
ncbi:MAG: DedA family protein [Ginsengibacter sp.]